jgi:cytoskeletal protein CcmA (bactofilin family)
MGEDKKPEEAAGASEPAEQAPPSAEQTAPKDALGKSNEELGEEAAAEGITDKKEDAGPPKKVNPLKQFLKRFNVYLLLFLLILVVAAIVAIIGYINGKKVPPEATIGNQTLTQDQLKQLANSDATVGDTGQTLTVQGNAIFSGQVLVRSNLNVAGTIQLGGTLSVPGLTVSGQTNLAATQVNSLQVATGSTFQGVVTLQSGLNVAGATSFSGPVTANQITVTKLIMSGNAQLQVPNHIAFTGASPARTINASVLGSGGSASINGSDTAGTININTGGGPVPGCFVTLTFNQKFTTAPHVTVTPVGSAGGLLQWYVNRSTTSFSICTNNAAAGNQVFAFDYFITN